MPTSEEMFLIRKDVGILLARAFDRKVLYAFGEDSPDRHGKCQDVRAYVVSNVDIKVFPDLDVWFALTLSDYDADKQSVLFDTNFELSIRNALEEANIDSLTVTMLGTQIEGQITRSFDTIIFKSTVNELLDWS